MTESKRAFYFKETANSLVYSGSYRSCGAISCATAVLRVSRCCPRTLGPRRNREGSQAVFKAQGRIDDFEVWDGARLVIRHPSPLTHTKPPSGRNHRVNR
jgi:hypothetical protein